LGIGIGMRGDVGGRGEDGSKQRLEEWCRGYECGQLLHDVRLR
jgi:ribosomal protein L15